MGYLGNGLTITGTQNSKRIVVDATPNQTISTVTGGYLIGQLDVYRNGVKLVDTQDYTASDGSSVTFLSAASQGDELEFVVFENFDVANALAKEGGTVNGSLLVSTASTFSSDLTVDGNVTIGGTLTYEDVTNIDSVGIITARSFVSIADSIVHTGDENTSIRFPAADTFTVETAGGERVRVTSGGEVRISNTDITSSTSADELIIGPNTPAGDRGLTIFSGTSGTGNIFFGDTDTSGVGNRMGTIIYDHSGNFMRFSTNGNNERVRITSGGDVGIGTTNPVLGRLQVERDIGIYRASSDPTLNFAVGGTSDSPTKTYRILIDDDDSDKFQVRDSNTARITLDGSGRVGMGVAGPGDFSSGANTLVVGTDSGNAGITISNGAADQIGSIFFAEGTGANAVGRIRYEHANNAMVFSTINAEAMRIDSSQRVAIGTATIRNSLQLDVEGAIGAGDGTTSNVSFANFDDPNSGMYFPAADQLGLVVGGSRKLLINSSGLTLNNGDLTLNNNDILGTGGINITGIVTATSYRGDGSQLSGISVGVTTHVGTASGIVTSVFLDDATDHKVTVTGFVTFTTTQSGTEGESHTLRIVNSGIATVGFSTYFLFPSGSVPVLPTADGAVSLISFTIHDSVGAGCTQLLAGASLNFSN